ncbi:hypothetical protein C1646_765642 [Rhizophagus diaphanus]|nr:hypothetical protein C1646_765642 [Rhizophagus diaphanus] [Rhizophagus sp. MUCL 43196]
MATLKECHDLIKTLWKEGVCKVTTLQKTTGFPSKTLYRWAKQLEETNDLKQESQSGHPKCLTSRKCYYLGHVAKLHKSVSSVELTETLKKIYLDLNIAPQTARAYQRKSWNKVIFSDETTFQIFYNATQVHYKVGEPRPYHVTVKHPFKVHVWGILHKRSHGLLHVH